MTRKPKAGGSPPVASIDREVVAAALADLTVAARLVDAVVMKVELVAHLRRNAATKPNRNVLKAKLDKVAKAAAIIEAAARDWDLTILLEHAASDRMTPLLPRDVPAPGHPELAATMADLQRRAKTAASHLYRVTGPGKMRDSLQDGRAHELLDSRTLCAMVATEAWRAAEGAAPLPDNRRAQALCAGLWQAAGGDETVAENDTKWRRWLIKARGESEFATSMIGFIRADFGYALRSIVICAGVA